MLENRVGAVGAICLHTCLKHLFVFSPNMFPVVQTQPKEGPKGLAKLAQLCPMITSLLLGACGDWEVI